MVVNNLSELKPDEIT